MAVVNEPKYWVFQTRIYQVYDQLLQAKVVTPVHHTWSPDDCGYGFPSPRQSHPYNVDLHLTYQINPAHMPPDNYYEDTGFALYSERLMRIMQSFSVRSEVFPATLIDAAGVEQPQLRYFIFHSLEGVQDAMDIERSHWQGNRSFGIPQLVLDYASFEHRPIFICRHVYVSLMRDDLKQEIQRQGITGFAFLSPERYRSGSYGFAPEFDE